MFSSKRPNYSKLRTNLRLCINRLKLMEKKKTELALKARREISDYIRNGKEDRARIRVEHIIREDYLVEAMEIIEMFCDMLLARFGLIEKMKEMDPGLEDAIASIIWVTPRLSAECQELREVSNQFSLKYGKEYILACQNNTLDNVNEKILIKLSTRPPPARLIEMYMTEIAKSYDVPFEADAMLLEDMKEAPPNLIDFDLNDPKNRGGGESGGGGGGGGNRSFDHPIYDNAPAVPRRSDSFPSPPAGAVPGAYPPPAGFNPNPYPPPAGAYPPPPQGYVPSASAPTDSRYAPYNGQNGHFPGYPPNIPGSPPPTYFPPQQRGSVPVNPAAPGIPGKDENAPPLPSRPAGVTGNDSAPPKPPRTHDHPHDIDRLPSYEELHGPGVAPGTAPAASQPSGIDNLPLPPRPMDGDSFGLPNVPSDSVATVGDEIDFDDLTKRFENLKKK